MDPFNIFRADTNPPDPTEMPVGLVLQILDHDAKRHDHFRLDFVGDSVM